MKHKKYAKIYDEYMNAVDYNSWYKFLKSYLPKKQKLNIIDLGCGTANLSILFAKDNHNVVAVDISEDMLEVAKEKNKYENLNFELMDITKEFPQNKFDFAMCNFDTVNYFSSLKDLENFFKLTYDSLNLGSTFIFDLVEEEIFDEMFENDILIDETENYTCIMNHEKLSKNKHMVSMTLFIKEGKVYNKYSEEHIKYIYEIEKVTKMLNKIGFKIYDAARNSKYGASRIFLVCKK